MPRGRQSDSLAVDIKEEEEEEEEEALETVGGEEGEESQEGGSLAAGPHFFGILRFPQITSDSVEHTSELNHSRARLICPRIFRNPESGWNPS